MSKETQVNSIQKLIKSVEEDYKDWNTKTIPWFRGEPFSDKSLTPRLFRDENLGLKKETAILQQFRFKALMYTNTNIPQKGHTDQWLFLAQHYGLPTRLLDWTEGLLYAALFAIESIQTRIDSKNLIGCKKNDDVIYANVWMLNPVKLNNIHRRSFGEKEFDVNEFPLTWYSPDLDIERWIREILMPVARMEKDQINSLYPYKRKLINVNIKPNLGNRNIRAAWESGNKTEEKRCDIATELPVAIHPTYIDPRISNQISRFTIWGNETCGLDKMPGINDDNKILRKYSISLSGSESQIKEQVAELRKSLRILGITRITVNSDLDNLTKDILEIV